jgi:two-component system sensor histidine kinase/response regulator
MMLTSNDYESAAKRCREMGVAAHLIKPVWRADLLSALTVSLQPTSIVKPAEPKQTNRPLPNHHSLHVLLAEDNTVNQILAARLLEKLGHKVVIAGNGKAALNALEAQSFDLVMMDVQMPELDGFAATVAIRAKEQMTKVHLPIIALTANAMTGDRELCLKAGMDDYIVKPINPALLKTTIERVMQAPASPIEQLVSR